MLKQLIIATGAILAATSVQARVESVEDFTFVCQAPGVSPITIKPLWNSWKWRDRQGRLTGSDQGPDRFSFTAESGRSVKSTTEIMINMESAPEKTVRFAMIKISKPVDYGHSDETQTTNVRGVCRRHG